MLTLIASWVGALGTVLAVFAALWLANRQNKTRMRVSAAVSLVGNLGPSFKDAARYFSVSAANAGPNPVTVTSIIWTVGRWRPSFFSQVPTNSGTRLPAKLGPGDVATFLFPMEMFERNLDEIASAWLSRRWARFREPRIVIGVFLSTGESHLVRPEEMVLDRLRAAFNKAKSDAQYSVTTKA